MGPAVVLGQRLAECAGPVGHSALADLAAGDRKLGTVTGKRREFELLIWLYDARPRRGGLNVLALETYGLVKHRCSCTARAPELETLG